MPRPRQAVILAGGRGERMRPLTDSTPKHMLPVAGRPFLAHLVDQVRDEGFERVLLLLGHLPEPAIAWFGNGARHGIQIDHCVTPAHWQTALRLKQAWPMLDHHFLLMYCDNYWPMRFADLWDHYVESECAGQMVVYENVDGYSRNNVAVDDQGRVRRYEKARGAAALNGVDVGYHLLRRDLIAELPAHDVPFEAALLPRLAREGRLGAYPTGHRYYGVGSMERLRQAEAFFRREPAVLVDRDGVLNERVGRGEYVESWAQWRWRPGALEALALLRQSGYRVIVVTNQAGIARGRMTHEALRAIHLRMREEARRAGGEIDAIYCCTHGWDEGCQCRKPLPGMLWKAQRDFSLDLTETWLVGDDERDEQAADRAGCLFARVDALATLLDHARRITRSVPEVAVATEIFEREEALCVSAS